MVDITDWHVIGESMRKVSTSCGPFKSTTTFCSEGMQCLSWCRRWGCHSWLQSMSAPNECVFEGWIPTQNRPTHLVHGQPGAWGTTIGSVVNNFWGYLCHVPPTLLWMMCVPMVVIIVCGSTFGGCVETAVVGLVGLEVATTWMVFCFPT